MEGEARLLKITGKTNEGLIEVIISPDDEETHSLLINNPVGCVYFLPLGAVSSTVRLDIVDILLLCRLRGIFLAWRFKLCCR